MASATKIDDLDHKKLDWLTVADDGGQVWRYRRIGPLDAAEPAQIEGHYAHGHAFRAALVRDADGHSLLRQPGAGLPRTIVVSHIDDPTNPWLGALGLAVKEEYERVGSET